MSVEERVMALQKRLIVLSDHVREHITDGHCKPYEPDFTVIYTVNNEMKGVWKAEIYSYLLAFHDGGRHHTWEANDLETLMTFLELAVEREEAKYLCPQCHQAFLLIAGCESVRCPKCKYYHNSMDDD